MKTVVGFVAWLVGMGFLAGIVYIVSWLWHAPKRAGAK